MNRKMIGDPNSKGRYMVDTTSETMSRNAIATISQRKTADLDHVPDTRLRGIHLDFQMTLMIAEIERTLQLRR